VTRIVVEHLIERTVAGKRLGRHVEHDERSRAFAVTPPSARAKINAVSHERFGGPFDQDMPQPLGSCTGNAMAGWLNCAPHASSSSPLMSEADAVRIYSEATRLDRIPGEWPPDDTGSSGLAVCKAAKKEGRISSYAHAFSVHAALWALQAAPVITGVSWYEGFDEASGTTPVKIAGQVRGGHEFLVVAFAPASSGSYLDGIVTAWNSWGPGWGDGGRFYFTARTWATLLGQHGDATCPVA
jgi:hypothetical protein